MTERGERFNALVGALVKERQEKRLVHRRLASAIGIHASTLLFYTAGKRGMTLEVLVDVCEALDESPYALVIEAYEQMKREYPNEPWAQQHEYGTAAR